MDMTFKRPPAAVTQLPHGPAHITKQGVLRTVHIDESSYEGTDMLIKEFMKQVKLHKRDERIQTGIDRALFWTGDQLTVERLNGLANYRCEDLNGYEMKQKLELFSQETATLKAQDLK